MVEHVSDGWATLTTGVEEGQADPARQAAATVRTVADAAQLACVLEVSAEKPGNITPKPLDDFDDTSFEDMLRCAIAIGPELARDRGVGETVLAAVEASRRVAPAKIEPRDRAAARAAGEGRAAGGPLRERLSETLRALDVADARAAYAAIRLAGAGGLDEPVEHDVRAEPDIGLREAMAAAARAGLGRVRVRDRLRADLRSRTAGARSRAARARRDRSAGPATARPTSPTR